MAGDVGKLPDLVPRAASAVAMAAAGLAALWLGGWWFRLLVGAIVGLIVWELGRMLAPAVSRGAAVVAGVGVAALVLASAVVPAWAAAVLLVLPAAGALAVPARHRVGVAGYLLLVCLAGSALLLLREAFGLAWVLWLVLVVIASDIAAYFAGRLIGGPKLWPRVSPKKTWSGTVAGWLAALAVGLAFLVPLEAGAGLLALSVLVAMAGQAGDIVESALKRRVGVKDSSALIPGHGGVMDRFDAMLAAACAFQLAVWAGLVTAEG